MEVESKTIFDFLPHIIGVGGTLLGVILGFLLNRLLTIGTVKIFINDFNKTVFKKSKSGQEVKSKDLKDLCKIHFYYDIDLYNRSSEFKIIRNLKMVAEFNSSVKEFELEDISTKEYHNNLITVNTLSCLTIPPKSVKKLRLEITARENIVELYNAKIYIQFYDYKDKKRIINIQERLM